MIYRDYIKPLIDFTAALLLIAALSPVLLLITILLAITQGKVFFIQQRPGYKERRFKMVKFRTMNDKRDSYGQLLPDMQRMHSLGKWLRKTSLDELPQLFNVLVGDMSFVGPRPLLNQYLPLYNDYQKRRHLVKPGITGWSQVNGRNAISWQQKFELDVWYVGHQSFLLDMKILLLTVQKVVKTADVNANEQETMGTFTGND